MVLAHTVFITLHAVAATVALVCGIITLHTGRGLLAHQLGVAGMAAALVPSLYFGWDRYTPFSRVVFCALGGLAVVMVVQALRAGRGPAELTPAGLAPAAAGRVDLRLVGLVGFNVISLAAAGAIVPVLRLGGGTMGVLLAVAGSVATAHVLVGRRRAQVLAGATGQERRAKALGGGGGLRPTA